MVELKDGSLKGLRRWAQWEYWTPWTGRLWTNSIQPRWRQLDARAEAQGELTPASFSTHHRARESRWTPAREISASSALDATRKISVVNSAPREDRPVQNPKASPNSSCISLGHWGHAFSIKFHIKCSKFMEKQGHVHFFYRCDIFTRVYEPDKVRRVITWVGATLESVKNKRKAVKNRQTAKDKETQNM